MSLSYETAVRLKEAGFVQTGDNWNCYHDEAEKINDCYIPTLNELIEGCGENFGGLRFNLEKRRWLADSPEMVNAEASNPPEAVAALYLALQNKK